MTNWRERLRARARELGLSDAEVARRAGLRQARYSHYVNGIREPDLATFVTICTVLRTTPNAVLGVTPNPEGAGAALRREGASILDTFSPEHLPLVVALLAAAREHADPVTVGSGDQRAPKHGVTTVPVRSRRAPASRRGEDTAT